MNVQTTRTNLDSNWRFKELNPRGSSEASDLDWMEAHVPGHVHLDLIRNGIIQDPFHRMAERACAWVDETDWAYETSFRVDELPATAFLVFHGLDTVAEIELNGEGLGCTDNMFIPHEFPVGGRLRAGENTLRVVFRSALRVGRERQQEWMGSAAAEDTLSVPHWFSWGPRSFVRKAQYMYGWDWGPELVSCGIWRSVELVTVPVARIVDWRYDVEFRTDDWVVVNIEAEIERAPGQDDAPLTLAADGRLKKPENRFCSEEESVRCGAGRVTTRLTMNIENPRRWEPNVSVNGTGIDRPALYRIRLGLMGVRELVDDTTRRIGLRTVDLVQEPDEDSAGKSFKFRVNGRDLFIKGANWIPQDSFPSRVTTQRLEHALVAARDAGFNMLRVWGGGLYESEKFYDICDRLGILVWQDFPYGCAYYPDKGEYAEAARVEAAAAVKRIRNHPSLALWCGNNENAQMFRDQWTRSAGIVAPRYVGERIYHEVLPNVLAEHDPKTSYWPSSPWSGSPDINPQSEELGDRHNWNVWHSGGKPIEGVAEGDWPNYRDDQGRFSSEFGFLASCGLVAWEKHTAPEDRWPRSPVVQWHDKTRKGYEKYIEYIQMHFPEPQTLEDLVYYSQLNQAEALKCGIEHWRRNKGRCWGTLFWQLDDCWPVQSWAVLDSKMDPKAAYFACKRFYAPLLVSLVRNGDAVEAHLTNDLKDDVQGELTLTIESFEGDVLASEAFDGYVHANTAAKTGEISMASVRGHEREVYIYARFEPYWEVGVACAENFHFLAEPKELRLANPNLSVNVNERGRDFELTLTAKRFAPYVWWRLEGLIGDTRSDNFFHLRAGEPRTVPIRRPPEIASTADARARLRLRSL